VKYLHTGAPETQGKEVVLTPEMLEVLPEELRSDLIEVLEILDNERIEAIIQQVWTNDRALQKTLSQFTDNFDYPAILRVLQKSTKFTSPISSK
jgi:hypothetical protein